MIPTQTSTTASVQPFARRLPVKAADAVANKRDSVKPSVAQWQPYIGLAIDI